MHIPDGLLGARTIAATSTLAAASVALAFHQARITLPARRVPLMGLAAAFVFAAQMLNFPVLWGTSGHLIGGALAAVLLGPGPAIIVLTAVLVVQCLLFNDGGVTALGANVFNMGVVGAACGYGAYRLLSGPSAGLRRQVMASFVAGWCATVLAAIACAGQIALSGKAPWGKVMPAMAGIHMLIGLGEGLITALVLVAVARTRPELLPQTASSAAPYGHAIGYGLLVCLGLAVFVSPWACSWDDGLEKVSKAQGLAADSGNVIRAPWPDYQAGGVGSEALATSIAGGIGTLVAFVLGWILSRILVPKSPARIPPGPVD